MWLQDTTERLQHCGESSKRRGAMLLLQWGARSQLMDYANFLLRWRCAIAEENEMWWQASRSEEIRLRTLLRGHGSISGGTAVRLLHRAWTNLSIGRVYWQWKCNYLVDDAFMSSAASHTDIFDAARRQQSVQNLRSIVQRLNLQRVQHSLCCMREHFQMHNAQLQVQTHTHPQELKRI